MGNQQPERIGEHEQKLAEAKVHTFKDVPIGDPDSEIVVGDFAETDIVVVGPAKIETMDDGMFEQPAADVNDLPADVAVGRSAQKHVTASSAILSPKTEPGGIVGAPGRKKAKAIAEKAKAHVKRGRK